MFSLPATFTYISLKRVRWLHLGHICPFIGRYGLCDFSLHRHPYPPACLNSPNWVFANSDSHKINEHHRVCLAFCFGVPKATTETKTSLYIWCSQADKHTALSVRGTYEIWLRNLLLLWFISSFVGYSEWMSRSGLIGSKKIRSS